MRNIPAAVKTLLRTRSMIGHSAPVCYVVFTDKAGGTTNTIQAASVHINREESCDSQRATIEIINVNPINPCDPGYYSPYRATGEFGKTSNEWMSEILPSKNIWVRAGYGNGITGTSLITLFTGMIDEVTISRDPQNSTISIEVRDMASVLLDKQVTSIYTTPGVETDEIQSPSVGRLYLFNDLIVTGTEVIRSGASGTGTLYTNPPDYTIDYASGVVTGYGFANTVYCSYSYVPYDYYLEYPLPAGIEKGTGWLTPGATLDPDGHDANDISAIVKDLCCRAGFATGDVTIQYSEITDIDPSFERMTYMDAISQMVTASGFEFVVDEYGYAMFHQISDSQPCIIKEVHTTPAIGGTFTLVVAPGADPVTTGKLVSGSLNMYTPNVGTGGSTATTTMWYKDFRTPTDTVGLNDDYYVNLATNTNNVYNKQTGSWGAPMGTYMVEGATHDYTVDIDTSIITVCSARMANLDYLPVSYVYAAWTFQEGWDIFSLNLNISLKNMYGKIRVAGDGTDIRYPIGPTLWDGASISTDKVLFVDGEYIDTDAKAVKCAKRLGDDCVKRYISTEFAAVAIPWLQIGDCIQVIESASTISEIYRITNLDFNYDPSGAIMQIKAYHVGYATG